MTRIPACQLDKTNLKAIVFNMHQKLINMPDTHLCYSKTGICTDASAVMEKKSPQFKAC